MMQVGEEGAGKRASSGAHDGKAATAQVPSNGALPPHVDGVSAAAQQYVEKLVGFLRQKGGQYKMSKIGVELPRPENAPKLGKVLKTYSHWFRRSGQKGDHQPSHVPSLRGLLHYILLYALQLLCWHGTSCSLHAQ